MAIDRNFSSTVKHFLPRDQWSSDPLKPIASGRSAKVRAKVSGSIERRMCSPDRSTVEPRKNAQDSDRTQDENTWACRLNPQKRSQNFGCSLAFAEVKRMAT